VAQAGFRNRFGHPALEVERRYTERGIAFVRSDTCGAWRWVSSSSEVPTCERDIARRYWHHRPADADGAELASRERRP
jgi:competence protein ComEC